jgi:N utilization substance protein B
MQRTKAPFSRRAARAIALKALYESDASGHPALEAGSRLIQDEEINTDGTTFAMELVRGTVEHSKEINKLIAKFAPAWPVEQIPVVDRNILRMAIFEMIFHGATPPKVVINEAVELAKTFGSESSPRFVNGVLGSLVEQHSTQGEIK